MSQQSITDISLHTPSRVVNDISITIIARTCQPPVSTTASGSMTLEAIDDAKAPLFA